MREFDEIEMFAESFLRSCKHVSMRQETIARIHRLKGAIDKYLEHPPDLGIHVEDGIKAEIKRGE